MNRIVLVSTPIAGCFGLVVAYWATAESMERFWPCGSTNRYVQSISSFTAPYWRAKTSLKERKIHQTLATIEGTYSNTDDSRREDYFGITATEGSVTISSWSNSALIRPGEYRIVTSRFDGKDLIFQLEGLGGVMRQTSSGVLQMEWTDFSTSRTKRVTWKRAWWGIKEG